MTFRRRSAGSGAATSPGAPVDWAGMADGRPWRLKRGKHYRGESRALEKAAKSAAEGMGKAVVTARVQKGKWDYLWVQFADYSLSVGMPCPRCGGTELIRDAPRFGHCTCCRATLILEEPPSPAEEAGKGSAPKKEGSSRSEYGEILSARILSPDGEEADTLRVEEEGLIEAVCHLPLPGVEVVLHLGVFTEEAKAFHWHAKLKIAEAGRYRVRVRLPTDFLAEREYRVKVQAQLRLGGDVAIIRLLPWPTFRAVGRESAFAHRDGVVRPELEWDLLRMDAVPEGAAS